MTKVQPYLKAILGFLTPGMVALGAAVTDVSPGGSAITRAEWIGLAVACVVTGGAVFAVPNKDPEAKHQAESVQPPLA